MMTNQRDSLQQNQKVFLATQQQLNDSYERCTAANVRSDLETPAITIRGSALHKARSAHADLLAYTKLLFVETHRLLSDPHEILLFTNAEALVIDIYSLPEVLEIADAVCNLRAGVSLHENSCGTNAIALALHHCEVSVVQGPQHFCGRFKHWCTVAAPVLTESAQPVGCVALVNHSNAPLAEKPALVQFMARELTSFVNINRSHDSVATADRNTLDAYVMPVLTTRQREVLTLFANGLSYKQIARRIGISSTKTVEEHLDAVRAKFQVASRRECIQRAVTLGLLDTISS